MNEWMNEFVSRSRKLTGVSLIYRAYIQELQIKNWNKNEEKRKVGQQN